MNHLRTAEHGAINKPTQHEAVMNISVTWCCEAALLELSTRAVLL